MTRPGIQITDHALVRWLERSGALDVEAVRARLAASLGRGFAAAARLEAARFAIIADGLIYIVRDGRLVSVIEDAGLGARVRAAPAAPDSPASPSEARKTPG